MSWVDIREGNPIKNELKAGRSTFGVFIRLNSVEAVEICAHAGCDFVVVDTEHAAVGWERTQAMIVAAEAAGTVPLLRVPNATRDLISRGLDAGAHGIVVPQVETAETAAAVVAATRYGPHGTRGTAGNRRSTYGLRMPLAAYTEAANAATLVVVQVESAAGIGRIDEIAAVEGVDVVFVGINDLSVDLGLDGAWHHPTVREHVERAMAACAARGMPFGIPVGSTELAVDYVRRGARFIAVSDVSLFGRAVASFVEEIRAQGV